MGSFLWRLKGPETSSLKGASGGRTSITYVGPNCLIGPLVMPLQSLLKMATVCGVFLLHYATFRSFRVRFGFGLNPWGCFKSIRKKKAGSSRCSSETWLFAKHLFVL